MKLTVTIITIFIYQLLIFNGCTNKTKDDGQNKTGKTVDTQIKLKWLGHWYGEGKKELLIREIAREFSLLNQNIKVELEFPHEMAKINGNEGTFIYTLDTIVKMVRQNKWPYDIMLCDAYLYQRVSDSLKDPYWGKKFLVDFKDKDWFIKAHKEKLFETDRYTKDFGDIAPGAYIEGVWNLLYASSEVEKLLGIKIKSNGMNLSDFGSYAKAVFKYNQKHENKITFLSVPHEGGDLMPVFNQIVLSVLEKDSKNTQEEVTEAIGKVAVELEKLAPYKPLETDLKYENDRILYHNKALFVFYPSWINLFWQKSNPEGEKVMHPCEIPYFDNKKAATSSGRYTAVFVVPKNSRNRKEAELLMRFISSSEIADKWVAYSKCPSGLKGKISYSDFGTDKYALFSQQINKDYNGQLNELSLGTILSRPNQNLSFQITDLLKGNLTANEALKNLRSQISNK